MIKEVRDIDLKLLTFKNSEGLSIFHYLVIRDRVDIIYKLEKVLEKGEIDNILNTGIESMDMTFEDIYDFAAFCGSGDFLQFFAENFQQNLPKIERLIEMFVKGDRKGVRQFKEKIDKKDITNFVEAILIDESEDIKGNLIKNGIKLLDEAFSSSSILNDNIMAEVYKGNFDAALDIIKFLKDDEKIDKKLFDKDSKIEEVLFYLAKYDDVEAIEFIKEQLDLSSIFKSARSDKIFRESYIK